MPLVYGMERFHDSQRSKFFLILHFVPFLVLRRFRLRTFLCFGSFSDTLAISHHFAKLGTPLGFAVLALISRRSSEHLNVSTAQVLNLSSSQVLNFSTPQLSTLRELAKLLEARAWLEPSHPEPSHPEPSHPPPSPASVLG